jgi:hypothetical protein
MQARISTLEVDLGVVKTGCGPLQAAYPDAKLAAWLARR